MRYVIPATLLLAIILSAGTAQEPNPTPQSKSPAPPFLPMPGAQADPAIKAAAYAHDDLKKSQDRVNKQVADIKARVEKIKPGLQTAVQEKEIVQEFKKLATLLRQQGGAILGKETEILGDVQIYGATLERAPRAFHSASEVFQKRAENAKGKLTQDAYRGMAEDAKKWAAALEIQAKEVPNLEFQIRAKFALVRETMVLLDDLGAFLDLIPDPEKKVQIQALLQAFDAHLGSINDTAIALRRLTDNATNGAPMIPPAGKEEMK